MEPRPETCRFCGICSSGYCVSEKDVQTCPSKSVADKRQRMWEEAENRRIQNKHSLARIKADIDRRFLRGHRKNAVRLSRADWEVLRENLKPGWMP